MTPLEQLEQEWPGQWEFHDNTGCWTRSFGASTVAVAVDEGAWRAVWRWSPGYTRTTTVVFHGGSPGQLRHDLRTHIEQRARQLDLILNATGL